MSAISDRELITDHCNASAILRDGSVAAVALRGEKGLIGSLDE